MKQCPANRHIVKIKDGYIIEIPVIKMEDEWLKDKKGEIMCFKTLDEARRHRNNIYKLIKNCFEM